MKTIYGFGMALMLVGAPVAVSADRDGGNYQACKQALHTLYGDGARISLRSIVRKPDGDHLRIKTTADGASRMLTCQVSTERGVILTDSDGVALTPIRDDYDSTEKLTLLD